jgi:hypothetical protein
MQLQLKPPLVVSQRMLTLDSENALAASNPGHIPSYSITTVVVMLSILIPVMMNLVTNCEGSNKLHVNK